MASGTVLTPMNSSVLDALMQYGVVMFAVVVILSGCTGVCVVLTAFVFAVSVADVAVAL